MNLLCHGCRSLGCYAPTVFYLRAIVLLELSISNILTKGYGVRATTIEGQNRCALPKFHVTDGQNTRDQITNYELQEVQTHVIKLRSVHSIRF